MIEHIPPSNGSWESWVILLVALFLFVFYKFFIISAKKRKEEDKNDS